ncbi:MAG: M20 family metallopeptidase [Candidatus Hodarchaeota archaeon]
MSENLIIHEIEANKEEYINLFRKLVQTNSYNPPGNEKSIALIIEQYLKEAGIKVEIFSFDNNRANLIAYLNENTEGRNLLYNGHMDVVPPGSEQDWKNDPLDAYTKRNKYIYGRGAADMKGGLAAMVIALKILKKLEIRVSGNLILNTVADEETGGEYGTKWSLDNWLKSVKIDFTVIGEPSGLNPLPKAILLGEKGRLIVKVKTNGISCHSSMPAMGKNAINMMSEIIENLDKLNEYIPPINPPIDKNQLKKLIGSSFPTNDILEKIFSEQPVLQSLLDSLVRFTKAVTVIKGGIKENVIPDTCEAIIDFRLLPDQDVNTIMKALRKIIEEDLGYMVKDHKAGISGNVFVNLEIVTASEGSYWKEWQNSSDLREFHQLVENIYRRKPFYFLLPASADAHYLRNDNFCTQTILFGPGSAGTAHAVNEYIEIQDFINAIKVYTLFAYRFLR